MFISIAAVSAWGFAWPGGNAPGSVRIVPVSSFGPGSVTRYRITDEGSLVQVDPAAYMPRFASTIGDGKATVYVVRFPDGDFRVFSGASTHLGRMVVWETDGGLSWMPEYVGTFVEGGHGERWAIDGTRIFGPAPRNLDEYRWHVDEGVLVVDLHEVVRGDAGGVAPPPYNVTSEGWATSGWPSGLTR